MSWRGYCQAPVGSGLSMKERKHRIVGRLGVRRLGSGPGSDISSQLSLDPGPLALDMKRAGPDGSGDLASKILWRSEDGTCPVLFHLGRGSSVELGSWRGSISLSKIIGLEHQVAVCLGLKRRSRWSHWRAGPPRLARVSVSIPGGRCDLPPGCPLRKATPPPGLSTFSR